jgi:hypothetical protein
VFTADTSGLGGQGHSVAARPRSTGIFEPAKAVRNPVGASDMRPTKAASFLPGEGGGVRGTLFSLEGGAARSCNRHGACGHRGTMRHHEFEQSIRRFPARSRSSRGSVRGGERSAGV